MIEIETRLLELLDWEEEELERIYLKAAEHLATCKSTDRRAVEESLRDHMQEDLSDEGSSLIFLILDQNIRKEMRIIEE